MTSDFSPAAGAGFAASRNLRRAIPCAAVLLAAIAAAFADEPPNPAPPAALPAPAELLSFSSGLTPVEPTAVQRTGEIRLGAPLRRAPEQRPRFLEGRLMPRLERQFLSVVPFQLEAGLGSNIHAGEHVLHEFVTESARQRAFKGLKRACEDYLMDTGPLSRLEAKLRLSGEKARNATSMGNARRDGGLSVSAEISHGLPRLRLRYVNGLKQFGFRLDLRGSAGFEFRSSRSDRYRLFAGYDAREEEYGVHCRIRF